MIHEYGRKRYLGKIGDTQNRRRRFAGVLFGFSCRTPPYLGEVRAYFVLSILLKQYHRNCLMSVSRHVVWANL